MKRSLILFGILLSVAMLDATSTFAATVTSAATGNWSAAATWTAGVGRTGTIAYSTSSTAVTGTGTLFTTELGVGSIITTSNPQGITRTVASITDNTHLTLTATAGNASSGKSYTSQGVGPGDAVIIQGGRNVTVNVPNALCASVQVGSPTGGGGAGTLTFAAGSQLAASGAVSLGNTGSVNRFGTVTMTAGGTLKCGSISSNSTTDVFTEGTGTLELTAANTFPTTDIGGQFAALNNLTISGATTLSEASTVNGALTLASGVLVLGSNNLTLGASATIAGSPSATAMVVATGAGQLRKTFAANGTFTFPVGDNTGTVEYSPVTLNFTSGTYAAAYAGVKVVNAKHPNNGSLSDFLNRYWTITQSGITSFSCNVSFKYVPADIVGSEAGISFRQWNGTSWVDLGTTDPVNHILSGAVSTFSDFTGGEAGVLPIQLASFRGSVLHNGNVALTWMTLSEVNNYGFSVQRKRASEQEYFDLPNSFLPGYGTTNESHTYNFADVTPGAGTWMYRLKQVDLDGAIHYIEPIQIDVLTGVGENRTVPTTYELNQNYPNPFNPSTKIAFAIPQSGHVTLKVYNLLGAEVATVLNSDMPSGYHSATWNASRMASGVYIYQLTAGKFVETKKLTLMR